MLAVLLLAAYTRIHDANAQGLWGDEGWSIWLARGDSLRDLTMTMVADHHGPTWSAMLRGWELLVGESVLALRWIAILFSIGCVALIERLGRALFNPAAGVGAALALTLLDKQVVLAQEVRDYPMVFFTMIAIALFYVRWWRGAPGYNGFAFVAASIFGLYLHYYCYMVNLAILVHAALTLPGRPVPPGKVSRWRHFLALNALIALAFLPWTFVVVHQFVNTPVDSEVLNIHGMPLNRATIDYLARESLGTPQALFGLLMLVGALAPLMRHLPGSMGRLPRADRVSGALLAVLWFGLPLIITAALHSRYPLLTDRNIAVIMPAIALLVGASLIVFERYGALFLVALITVNGVFTTSSYFEKHPWRAMAAQVAPYTPPGERVLLDVEGEHAALWYHMTLALAHDSSEVDRVVNLLPPEAEGVDRAVSLYDYRKRYRGNFIPAVQGILAQQDGLWLAYWGDFAKKHDVFDLLDAEGFVRTATLHYQHKGYPIYAYRYDRLSVLQDVIARFTPPDAPESALRLHRATWPDSARAGDTLSVLLWWSAAAPPPVDYTVSAFLLDASGLRAQADSYPLNGQAPTSGWIADQVVFDPHVMRLPANLPPGEYSVAVKLYTWWDGAVLGPDSVGSAGNAEYAVLGTVRIE